MIERLSPFDVGLGFYDDADPDWEEYSELTMLLERALSIPKPGEVAAARAKKAEKSAKKTAAKKAAKAAATPPKKGGRESGEEDREGGEEGRQAGEEAQGTRAMTLRRREFLVGSLATGVAACAGRARTVTKQPMITHGVQSGDVSDGRALSWARCDEPARMVVEWDTTRSLRSAAPRCAGPRGQPPTTISPASCARRACRTRRRSRTASGSIARRRAARASGRRRAIRRRRGADAFRFAWTGDTCGQGFGRNPEWGGLRGYAAMRDAHPRVLPALRRSDLRRQSDPRRAEARETAASGEHHERARRARRTGARRFPRALRVQPRGRSRARARGRGARSSRSGTITRRTTTGGPGSSSTTRVHRERDASTLARVRARARCTSGCRFRGPRDPSGDQLRPVARRLRVDLPIVPHAERCRPRRGRTAMFGARRRRGWSSRWRLDGALEDRRVRSAAGAGDRRRPMAIAQRRLRRMATGPPTGREVELAGVLAALEGERA